MAHDARVVHHVPGRIRVRLSRHKRNIDSLERIAEALGRLPGLTRVEMNPSTGSVLLLYDPEAHSDFHRVLAQHGQETGTFDLELPGIGEAAELAEEVEREAEFLAEHSRSALAVVNALRNVNRAVREKTHNVLDLKVLLPAAIAAAAIGKSTKEKGTPFWVSLAVFSFNSFLALHRPAVHRRK